ncbi:MAG: hypothetical protein O3C40_15110 [Planctomycetota bacterium]|nr:hypothetical protein [Planctomycetota bacterium]
MRDDSPEGEGCHAAQSTRLAIFDAKRNTKKQNAEQALADPQTIEQFRICLRDRDYRELTPEQQERFDRLLADQPRSVRRERRQSATVTEIQSEGAEGLAIAILKQFDRRSDHYRDEVIEPDRMDFSQASVTLRDHEGSALSQLRLSVERSIPRLSCRGAVPQLTASQPQLLVVTAHYVSRLAASLWP